MSKKVKYWLIGGLFTAIVLMSTFAGGFFAAKDYYLSKELSSVKFIIDAYHKYYFYEEKDLPHLISDSILDQYSQYYTKEEYEVIKKASLGYRRAVGVSFKDANSLVIESVSYNSPAENAGVKKGGLITKVNGEVVSTQQEFKEKIVGKFSLTVDYSGTEETYENLEAKEFKETYVKYYDGLNEYYFSGDNVSLKQRQATTVDGISIDNDTLYVKYASFNAMGEGKISEWERDINTSCGQFKNAMDFFKAHNKTKIILDLRGNGGGYLSILRSIASHFVSSVSTTKPLVMYAKYKNGQRENYYSLTSKKASYNFEKIIVLADKNTASASEALIGALLDYDNDNLLNVVVEINNGVYASYGKGIMQDTVLNKISGEAIKLTVAETYWPVSNVCIHGSGVSKAISQYSSKIYESKDQLNNPIDALDYAVRFIG